MSLAQVRRGVRAASRRRVAATAAITRVRANSLTQNTTGLSLTVPLGATATTGHLLLTFVTVDKNASSFTNPAGWTQLASQVGASVSIFVCGKVADGTETGVTVAFGANGGAGCAGAIVEYAGVNTASPYGPSHLPAYSDTAVTSITLDPPAATAAGAAAAFLGIDSGGAVGAGTGAFQFSQPSATGFAFVTAATNTNGGTPSGAILENLSVASGQDIAPTFSWASPSDQVAGFIQLLRAA